VDSSTLTANNDITMRISPNILIPALIACTATGALAQKAPEVRPLGNVGATSTDSLGMVSGVRHLPGGKLLVNDMASRRVLLLGPDMKVLSVVADTTAATANAYGSRIGNLVPFRGDSTLYVDASSLSMLVIDGAGEVVRVMSVPRSQDVGMLATSAMGGMGFDGQRMIYRGMGGIQMRTTGPSNPGAAAAGFSMAPTIPDTMPILRVNLATRALDTAAFIKVSSPKTSVSRSDDGQMNVSIEINPLPVVDEYAVLSDGRVAVVRGREYRVEFIEADGKVTTGAKIPFEWKRLSDDEKSAFIDSVKAVTERNAAATGGSAAARVGAAIGASMGGGAGGAMIMTQTRTVVGGEPPMRGAGGGTTTVQMAAPQVNYVSPEQLPDYQPAFFGNSARGDMDGNLWVRIIPPKPIAGGQVYDVINGQGELVDRVQIPVDRTIIGFGTGGVVYMTYTDGGVTRLERASYR
jgi:hypothetical protein